MPRIGRGIQQQILRGTPILGASASPGTRSGSISWGVIASPAVATRFTPSADLTAITLQVGLAKVGSPSDNVVVTLQSDSGGLPSGTILATLLTVSGASLPLTTPTVLTGSISVSLTAGTRYWVVFSRDGATSNVNAYVVSQTEIAPNDPSYPAAFKNSSLVWVADTTDAAFWFSLASGFAAYASNIGPQPPVLVAAPTFPPVVTTLSVNTATGVLTNQRRAQQRFPRQWYEGSETDVGSPRPNASSIIVYPERALGPDPPAVVNAPPPLPPPVQVNLASGLYTNQRRVQQRHPDTFYTQSPYLSPLAVVTTPGQLAVATHPSRARPRPIRSSLPLTIPVASTRVAPPVSVTTFAAQSRLQTASRRFPLPGHDETTVFAYGGGATYLTADYETGTNGNSLSTGDTGSLNAFDLIVVTAGNTLTYDAANPLTVGGKSAKHAVNNATNCNWLWGGGFGGDKFGSRTRFFVRGYFKVDAAPASNTALFWGRQGSVVAWGLTIEDSHDGASCFLALRSGTSQPAATGGFAIPFGTIIRVELLVDYATGSLTCRTFVGSNSEGVTPDVTFGFTGQTLGGTTATGELRIGTGSSSFTSSFNLWSDAIAVSLLDWVGPYAPAATRLILTRRRLGPFPPLVVNSLFTATPVSVNPASGLLTNQRRYEQRRPHSFLIVPQQLAQPPPAEPITVTTVKTRPRHPASFYTEALYLSPLAVVTTPGQLAVAAHEVRRRPRLVQPELPLVIVTTATFVAPPVSVNLQDNRVRGFGRRHFPSVVLNPPTVLQTFAGPDVLLQAIQTRVQRQRRRLPGSFLSPPATLEPETVALAERQIRVALARTRPRHTVGTKLAYTVYAATNAITVAIVRTRPRPTRHALTAITYPQAGVGFTHLVRVRPRPTSKFVAPPSTLQPYSVTVAEDTVRVTVVRTRPRPTTRRVLPPTVLQTFAAPRTPLVRTRPRHTVAFVAAPATLEPEAVSLAERQIRVVLTRTRPRHTVGTRLSYTVYPQTSKIAVALVRTRPRPTVHALTTVSYPATSEITVVLARTRPRPTTRRLGPPIFYAAASEIAVTLTRTRPRPTRRFLAPPTTLQTFGPPVEAEIAVRVPADDRARRKPRSFQIQPVTNAATSEISVTLTRIRPRPTRRFLTAVTYPATSEIAVALVRARSRPLTRYIAAPATLQPYSVTIAEDTVRVAAVRTRPRHTLGTRLNPPTVLRTFAGPAVTLTHTRPRPTLRRLAPPTVIRVPSVEQREDTITVALIRTRPRPTEKFIVPPVVRTFPPVVTTLLPAHVVKTRPRPTTRFLRPPTVVIPLPTLRMQTITVATVRTRPRPTRHSLTPLAFYRQTSKIQVVLVRTRPRPTTKRLSPPIFYKQTSEITVLVARTRPRQTTRILTAVRYEQTSEIAVALTRIRPRPTRHFVAPPTVLQTFGPPVEVEIAVRTPLEDRARRRPRSFAIQPVTYAATSEISVALARTRPRPTRSLLRPPTAVRAFAAAPATVALARARPRRTRSSLLPPTVVRTFAAQPILVATVATRPRPTTARIEPPTRLRPAETNVRVTLARTRPRHVRSNLTPVAVVTQPPTVTTLTVVLTRTRPRPTRNLLAAPATLRRVVVFIAEPLRVTTVTTRPTRTRSEFVGGPVPELISLCGWTSGEVVAATDSAGSSILVSGTQGGAVVVASTESEVKPVAESRGEDSATGRTEGMDKLAGT